MVECAMHYKRGEVTMQENRNAPIGFPQDCKGTVCIDTQRVLDCCRDRDCYEDTRVYLTHYGEEILASATAVKTKCAKTLWAYVGIDEVPFNNGFYQITVKYYILVELEACLGVGRSQTFKGLATLEKTVILYGGEGTVTSYTSSPGNNYCNIGDPDTVGTNAPKAVVETVEPIVLGTKVKECNCTCGCECCDLPDIVNGCLDGEISTSCDGPKLYVSFGIFSVIRIERPAQLLVQATDYSVPDKECTTTCEDDPCHLFRTIAFPVSRFRGTTECNDIDENRRGGCGCNKH